MTLYKFLKLEQSLSTVVEASLKRAERDNDLIYHQDVPSTASLLPIQDMKDVIFASIPAGLSDPKLVVGEGNVILGELSGWGVLKAIGMNLAQRAYFEARNLYQIYTIPERTIGYNRR